MNYKFMGFKTYVEARKSADYKIATNQYSKLIGFGYSKKEKHFYIMEGDI